MMSLRLWAFAAFACVALPAFAKPLYLTVPRAYGTDEDVAIDLAFSGREPVELRVLRPNDLEAFVRAQPNLRRAWTEPPLVVNPGRYLARGINALASPGPWWRDALSQNARAVVTGALPESTDDRRLGTRLHQTAPKLVGLPPGMTLVRREMLNLDLGGLVGDFTVPGFEAWSSYSSFQERRVTLRPLPAGVYVLQVVQGRVEGQVTLVVTDLTVQVKQTDGTVLVRVAGRNLAPSVGTKVALYSSEGTGPTATTDQKGEARLPSTTSKLIVTARDGDDVAIVDTDFYSTLSSSPDVFIYSDRPIYKPGDEVGFRGLVRQPDSFLARLFTPKSKRVKVRLTPGVSTTVDVDAFGSFHGVLKVPADAEPGVVRVVAEVENRSHQSEARVREYVKPTFYVEVEPENTTVQPGGKLKAVVKARRYSGGAPKEAAYEYFLYRTRLDSPAWVDDAGLGGEGSRVTYGSVSTSEGQLSVQHRLYSSVSTRVNPWDEEDPWKSAPRFDLDGNATIEFDVPALEEGDAALPWRYSITVRARDEQGAVATGGASLFLADCEVLGALSSSARLVRQGEPTVLAVRATTLDGRVYGRTSGHVEFEVESPRSGTRALTPKRLEFGEDGIARVAWPTSEVGTVVARVIVEDRKGESWAGEHTLLVAGTDEEAVANVAGLTLETPALVFEPGERAEVIALLPAGWGVDGTNQGNLWVTLSGNGIHSTELVRFDGRTYVHGLRIEKRFGSAVHVAIAHPTPMGRWEERSTALRVIPKERALSVQVEPSRLEAMPFGAQEIALRVVNHKGEGVRAQVSVGVVDKAVYAVQREFRPSVLDFFYPLVRNNVATFYSAEFQGYGYGEVLARFKGAFAPYEFAAIKPPSNQPNDKDRDTAYWNPAVTTDADGRASVRFNLPANQTLWVATVVAADASGRFGEGTAEFATRGGLNAVVSLPLFMRMGDEAQGSVRLSRGLADGGALDAKPLSVSLIGSKGLEGQTLDQGVQLQRGDEAVVAFDVKAAQEGAGQVALAVAGGQQVASARRIPVRSSSFEETIRESVWGGGLLSFKAPEGATVAGASLSLRPTTVDVALATIRDLMSYPYGCLEQLVATTVPNVAVYRVLEETNALAKLDPDAQALMEQARSQAVLGTARILAMAVKGGGFTWFSGYATPSPAQTLMALDGLAYAVDAGLVERNDPRLVESLRWVSELTLSPELDALRAWVVARLDGGRAAAQVRAFVDRAPEDDLYSVAMAMLAAKAAGVNGEPAIRGRLASMAQGAKPQIAKLAVWEPPEGRFHDFPLRRTGLAAVASHALLQDRADVDTARRLFVENLTEPGLSTLDRSTALLHGLWLLRNDSRELKARGAPVVRADKGDVKLSPVGLGFEAPVALDARAVDVAKFDGVAILEARVRRPYATVEASEHGLTVRRDYYVLRGDARVRLGQDMVVHPGEDVYVELQIGTALDEPGRRRSSAYTVVEDAVPAGFEPLDEDKHFRGAPFFLEITDQAVRKRDIGAERVTFFIEEPSAWTRAPRTVGYVMRARFPGRFVAPPATIEDMYMSSLNGRTGARILEVAKTR